MRPLCYKPQGFLRPPYQNKRMQQTVTLCWDTHSGLRARYPVPIARERKLHVTKSNCGLLLLATPSHFSKSKCNRFHKLIAVSVHITLWMCLYGTSNTPGSTVQRAAGTRTTRSLPKLEQGDNLLHGLSWCSWSPLRCSDYPPHHATPSSPRVQAALPSRSWVEGGLTVLQLN